MSLEPTVFVVDDDPAVRELFQAYFQSSAWRVEIFEAPADFLAAFDPTVRGCLILDYELPGMNGLSVLDHLNAQGAMLPVILISASCDQTLAAQAMESGAWTFIEKSSLGDRKYLFDQIRQALDLEVQQRAGVLR